ncbi:hypothetical protein NQZ68_023315 [Dissostichus eleginoides]|nr:hypothetical protein NQZ68_023315 [Dissostichus eleginoides]
MVIFSHRLWFNSEDLCSCETGSVVIRLQDLTGTLQDGSTGLVSAQLFVYSGIEGEDVRVECSIPSYRSRKLFCKEPCEYGNILIEITDAPAQRGKYRIDYVDGYSFVTITQLTKSDSGRYRCAAGTPEVSYNIDQLTQSDSGWYRCGLGRPDSKDPYQRFRLIVTDGVVLYVSLTLVVLVIVSSLSVLVFCRKRTCKAKKPHVETQRASAPEAEDDPSQHTYSEIKFVEAGRPTAVSTVTLSVLSTLFLWWKLALMSPLCTLLLTTPNNSHSLAEEAGVN